LYIYIINKKIRFEKTRFGNYRSVLFVQIDSRNRSNNADLNGVNSVNEFKGMKMFCYTKLGV